jgi:biotin carboxylase
MDKRPLVLFLGSVRKGELEAILANSFRLGIILDTNRPVSLPQAEGFDFVAHHDFSGPLSTLDAVIARIQQKFDIVALINLREFYVRAHAHVANVLGLPGLPVEAVERVLNKTLMRRTFVSALGETRTPRFREISQLDEVSSFADMTGFPIILKPNNLYGSLFVRAVHDQAELRREFPRLHAEILAHVGSLGVIQSLEKIIQAEEFVSGSVHSIDCLVDGDQHIYLTPVIDVSTGRDIGQDHFGHVIRKSDSKLPARVQREMAQLAQAAVHSLKICNTAAHVEFIVSESGPKLLEIAARPGGHRNRVLEMTHGISFNYQYLRMLLGHTPDLEPRCTRPFALFTPYPRKEMVFQGIRHLDAVTRLPSFRQHELKVRGGARIGTARNGFMSSWIVELSHPDGAALHRDMAWLVDQHEFFEEKPCAS